MRFGSIIYFIWVSQVLNTVWCYISSEAASFCNFFSCEFDLVVLLNRPLGASGAWNLLGPRRIRGASWGPAAVRASASLQLHAAVHEWRSHQRSQWVTRTETWHFLTPRKCDVTSVRLRVSQWKSIEHFIWSVSSVSLVHCVGWHKCAEVTSK